MSRQMTLPIPPPFCSERVSLYLDLCSSLYHTCMYLVWKYFHFGVPADKTAFPVSISNHFAVDAVVGSWLNLLLAAYLRFESGSAVVQGPGVQGPLMVVL